MATLLLKLLLLLLLSLSEGLGLGAPQWCDMALPNRWFRPIGLDSLDSSCCFSLKRFRYLDDDIMTQVILMILALGDFEKHIDPNNYIYPVVFWGHSKSQILKLGVLMLGAATGSHLFEGRVATCCT